MIQDIAPHRLDNQYRTVAPEPDSYVLHYRKKEVLLKWEGDHFAFPTFAELESENEHLYEDYTYLFEVDQKRYYLMHNIVFPTKGSYRLENTEIFRSEDPDYLHFAGITGYQLYRWYESRRFCGRCGKPMVHSERERMVQCPACGQMEYPKICPAVIVGVTDGNRLLMSKYANSNNTRYALLAGFSEIGETVEGTVRREVMEEVGLKVKNIRYYKSQPWAFTDTLLMGFFAELDGEDSITLDRDELAMAEWFEREDIPVKATNLSLTNEMIICFKEGRDR